MAAQDEKEISMDEKMTYICRNLDEVMGKDGEGKIRKILEQRDFKVRNNAATQK
jgi:hypothetical protein